MGDQFAVEKPDLKRYLQTLSVSLLLALSSSAPGSSVAVAGSSTVFFYSKA